MTVRIFLKLIGGTLCVLILALAAVDILASRVAESSYREKLVRELSEKGNTIAALLRPGDLALAGRLKEAAHSSAARLTVVAGDGRVLADSEAESVRMDNHRGRPEVATALKGSVGSVVRKSGTTGIDYLYVAVPYQNGALRLAVPLTEVQAQVGEIRRRMLVSTALAFLPAVLVAALLSRFVSAKLGAIIEHAGKLAQGDFRARLGSQGMDELGVLAQKLNETGGNLEHMRDELQREHQELEKLERVRKDFVINVSHELRTPLASIQGYTETLLNGAVHEPETNVRFLHIIRQNVERLTNLASDLLTISRIELKSQKFQFAFYYANGLLIDCVDAMRPIADKKKLCLHLEPAPDKCEVFCDSKAVHQALTNLLDNAIKYTPENGDIYIGARRLAAKSPATQFVEFYVRDTGIGIPAPELPRLFERFYRVDKARSRELGGTGLGLAIVKHLARAHTGDVSVTSEPGLGSRFAFTIPVDDPGAVESGDKVQGQLTVS
ncbi:MAG: HAMP domain-containing protein [Bryobacterales bacterium]|nr:HAMP domain-containing protein [Bryobacterales bacterium]